MIYYFILTAVISNCLQERIQGGGDQGDWSPPKIEHLNF